MDYLLHILFLIAVYQLLAMSLNLCSGWGGIVSLCHAAFFGIGGYTSAMLSIHLSSSIFVCLAGAGLTAGLLGITTAMCLEKAHDDRALLITMSIQLVFFALANNLVSVTGGPFGVSGIPRIDLLGVRLESVLDNLVVAVVGVSIVFYLKKRLLTTRWGIALSALGEDEELAQSLGCKASRIRFQLLTMSGAISGIAGGLYAHYVTYIDPTNFTLDMSVLILSMVVLGGNGRLHGGLIGPFIMITLLEGLRFAGFPNAVAAHIRQMIFGGLLLLMLVYRPIGLKRVLQLGFGTGTISRSTKAKS